ncbi:DEAD/DEAH box helicase, partial [bacterium]|nr:DEAD/DEAH box helicase [candidate division CSSED10-310 bacterium]
DLWERVKAGDFDAPLDFLLKQLSFLFPLQNTGGQLSNSRTDLLPHQILLTRDIVSQSHRRLLIADEVGLGKTIEMGMILRELITRKEADRILIVTPAGLVKNWQSELREAFRLDFEILGIDFNDHSSTTWESKHRVIVSIDTIKRPQRMDRLLGGPRWDIIVFDEAHHLSRLRYGKKIQPTQNYKFAEAIKNHVRDLFFLSATPHQGNGFQFWSLIQLLDDTLFDSEESLSLHREFLSNIMIRRTKREVTDKDGNPIFMRRQVHAQSFQLAMREQLFYDELTEYLKKGYFRAGVGINGKTTSEQRAIGFVMTTFQKIMSSSMRAIRQALRRRLLVLLIRQQMQMDYRRRKATATARISEEILRLHDKMQQLASQIIGIPLTSSSQADMDTFIAQMKQKVSRKYQMPDEITEWSLDGDESGDDGIYADATIPDEVEIVSHLLQIIPENIDRKFDTLARAIDTIRLENPHEKFVIFTQYVETLYFLEEQLKSIYGSDKVVHIKGGPLLDKIEAKEMFWEENGAQFLICTSAGGEGINLQAGHILFNYDLPWNPMAVEQRIGRIHRYGQKDTVQVYNLIAEGTVEENIYRMLDEKLKEIASQIGKIDEQTGEPREDFKSEVLGYIGSSSNYLEWYRNALVDKDYQRTAKEIEEALRNAYQAIDALKNLTMDLSTFNLQDYLNIEGSFSLEDLKEFAETAIIRFGGSVLPREEFCQIITPKILLKHSNVLPKYECATFNRDASMRKRSAELLGLGHPLIDALIMQCQDIEIPGDTTFFPRSVAEQEPYLVITTLMTIDLEDGKKHKELKIIRVSPSGDAHVMQDDWLMGRLENRRSEETTKLSDLIFPWDKIRQSYEGAIGAILTQIKTSLEKPVGARIRLLGISIVA